MFPEPEAPVEVDQATTLSGAISDLFEVQNYTVGEPKPDHIRFRGRFTCKFPDCFDELRGRFEKHGFTPFIREEDGQTILIAAPVVFEPAPSNWIINLVLLLATIASLLFVGGLGYSDTLLGSFVAGIPYAVSLMLILGAHELGHYFAARYHNVPVTLPYFIPFPIPPIGTMGAFIRLKAPVKNKRALFDVGVAGPLAGLAFAIPILIIGLMTSDVGPLPEGGYMLEGNSILYGNIKLALFGQRLPDFINNVDVSLNQIAWAGWVGLLVTGLNLIPVGQLDGGHIAYVLFGKRARLLYWPVIAGLVALLIITRMPMWGLWIVMLFVFGRQYAEPLDDVTPVDQNRRLIAIFSMFIFLLVFVPIPLRIIAP